MSLSLEQPEKKSFTGKVIFYLSLCFFFSGMCGLIYQVLWVRMLGLIFGHTTFAISTVITAFMGGLALGSYLLGRWADREGKFKSFLQKQGVSPVFLMYGILEIFVGIYCLFTPLLFKVIEFVYLGFSWAPFYALSLFRFLLCILVLIIPTFCMGGTLPLLSKFLIRNSKELSSKLGFLYFINTLGAVLGTVLAGFYLIVTFGLSSTLYFAAVINIGIGILIYFLNKNPRNIFYDKKEKTSPGNEETEEQPVKEITWVINLRLLVIVFAFAGFASMIYEITWTRALALSLGSSTYAFSTMLATFLFGIALGSVIYSNLSRKISFSPLTFGWIEIFIAFSCLLTIPVLGNMPLYVIKLFPLLQQSYTLILLANFVLSFAVMIIPTTLMGFVFPLVGKLYTQTIKKIGKSIGDIYAINTVGCILGSFLAGFVLIPFTGVQNSMQLAIGINLFAGAIFIYFYSGRKFVKVLSVLSLIVFILFAGYIPSWNPVVMSSGSAIYADYYLKAYGESNLEGKDFFQEDFEHLKFYKDGISATVALYDFEDILILKINGKSDASTPKQEVYQSSLSDMPTQLLSGYLPLLYYQNKPENVFIMGLGSGISAKAVQDFPEVNSVECVEIEPAVIEVNSFFAPYNDYIMEDRRFKMITADGRNALLASKKKYDIIITEPSNPWIAGIGSLFTREYYEICKERMKPEGIICQWLQMYSLSPEDFEMIIRTFYTVFPEGVIWRGREGDLLLLGSQNPLTFDCSKYEKYYETNDDFRKGLTGIGIDSPDKIFTHYITSSESLDDMMAGILNTDNLPVLEFSSPRSLYMETVSANLLNIYQYKSSYLPIMKEEGYEKPSADYYITMINFYNAYIPESGDRCMAEALSIYPHDFSLNRLKFIKMIQKNQILKAEKELLNLIEKHPEDYRWYLELSKFYRNQGLSDEAGKMYFKAHLLVKKKIRKILMEDKLKKS